MSDALKLIHTQPPN